VAGLRAAGVEGQGGPSEPAPCCAIRSKQLLLWLPVSSSGASVSEGHLPQIVEIPFFKGSECVG
jgi:hypothetical protein